MSNKQIQLYRLDISKKDLLRARKFAEYILQKRLDEIKTEQSKLIRLAFNTSLIITYWRPFSRNQESNGQLQPSLLSQSINEVLTDDEIELHKKIKKNRNREHAHSQASAYSMESLGLSPSYSRNPFADSLLLKKSELEMLVVLINKWIKHIGQKKVEL
jgi:hypothetical protein